ncbi:SDR family oxidoreductase [uncultured Jatrophihabitans sp.]|uniref:SDR family oxidoreductase n=1 Tax=uncultured Jatrophihabitans sp. TaxID=1610747 RepID=UPI0035C9722A
MKVAVAGGTGLLGRFVVQTLTEQGHEPVVLARTRGADLLSGDGVREAVDGCGVVIDVSNFASMRKRVAVESFEAATRHLLEAGRATGVVHHVAVSIVGIDRVPMGYYQGKLAQERLLADAPVPASVLRATQFHEFAAQTLRRSPGPLAVLPRMRMQPVAAREVAQALVALAFDVPLGRAPELAGPQVLELIDLAKRVLAAQGSHRTVVPLRLPGAVGRGFANGALLPTGEGPRGTQTFDEWLRATY